MVMMKMMPAAEGFVPDDGEHPLVVVAEPFCRRRPSSILAAAMGGYV